MQKIYDRNPQDFTYYIFWDSDREFGAKIYNNIGEIIGIIDTPQANDMTAEGLDYRNVEDALIYIDNVKERQSEVNYFKSHPELNP